MRGFVGCLTMQMFIRRSCVIDFIEIHAVVPTGCADVGILLVDQIAGRLGFGEHLFVGIVVLGEADGKDIALRIHRHDFPKRQSRRLDLQANILALKPLDVVHTIACIGDRAVNNGGFEPVIPTITKPLGHVHGIVVGPVFAIITDGNIKACVVHTAIIEECKHLRFIKLKNDLLFASGGNPTILRCNRTS